MSNLQELLRLVAVGGVHSYEELAADLSVSVPLLEAMLENLARLGYLRSAEATCGQNCDRCPVGGCSVAGRGQLWVLTEKGARAAG
jgi:DNA-binding IscR family transcriptional regulator